MQNNQIFVKNVLMKKVFRYKDMKMLECVVNFSTPLSILSSCLLFTLSCLLFTPFAFANDSNWGVQPLNKTQQNAGEASEKVWNRENNENIYENYGSEESPAFLNRENVDPATSNFNENYDYDYDDEPYNSNVN